MEDLVARKVREGTKETKRGSGLHRKKSRGKRHKKNSLSNLDHRSHAERDRSRSRDHRRHSLSKPRDRSRSSSRKRQESKLDEGRPYAEYFGELLSELSRREAQLQDRIRSERVSKTVLPKKSPADELGYVSDLIQVMLHSRWNAFDRDFFIVSAAWFSRWANYVKSQPKGENHPGPVDNECLMMESKEYYHNHSCPNSACNNVIKESAEENRDYFVMSKEIWDFIFARYGGMELRRENVCFGPNGLLKQDIRLEKAKIVFIKKGQTSCDSPKHIHFPCNFTLRMLKRHLIQSFRSLRGKTENDLRLWKLVGIFAEFMRYYRSQLDANTLKEIPFRGYSLEKCSDQYVAELGFTENDIVFVETNRPEGWVFALDMNNPGYFWNKETARSDQVSSPSYDKYWEHAYSRPFALVESPCPEYERIKRIIDSKTEEQKVGHTQEFTKYSSLLCEEELKLEQPVQEPKSSPPSLPRKRVEKEVPKRLRSRKKPAKSRKVVIWNEPMVDNVKSAVDKPLSEKSSAETLHLEIPITLPNTKESSEQTTEKMSEKSCGEAQHGNENHRNSVKLRLSIPKECNGAKTRSKTKVARPSGIKNIGNSCYISSSVQCLKHTRLLWEYIKEGDYISDINPKGKGDIAKAFGTLVKSLGDDNQIVAPQQFKKVVAAHSRQFSGTDQSDAHEFLTFLIDRLHEELRHDAVQNSDMLYLSKIGEIFYGAFESTIECTQCRHVSHSQEPFMCISLPIEGNVDTITLLMYTQSHHLFMITCKFDDESTKISVLKEEIRKQLIVGDIDMYLIIDNARIEPVADTNCIGDITKHKNAWNLYAVEKSLDAKEYIAKVDILRHPQSFIMTVPDAYKTDADYVKENVRKFIVGAGSLPSEESSKLPAREPKLEFRVTKSEEIVDSGPWHFHVTLQTIGRSSELRRCWTKLPQKHIEFTRQNMDDNYGTLHGCLSKFTSDEKLQGTNQWMCPDCKSFKDAKKSIGYFRLPKVLIIHLKRFKVVGKKTRKKISALVNFPHTLLLPTTDGLSHTYNLYATLNHIGDIERGHYTAYCRNLNNRSEWLEFDDNKVKLIDPSQLETNKAYVLFYEHVQSNS